MPTVAERRSEADPPRRTRDRARTEANLLSAVRRILERDGVLAGLKVQEVAAESGVNRGQIYQMYSNRQALLRAALTDALQQLTEKQPDHWEHDFAERRIDMLRWSLHEPVTVQLKALLVLDGDPELQTFPAFDRTREALERDKATGALPADADGEALHVLTAAAYMGYVLFRESFARDVDIPLAELDKRVTAAYRRAVEDMATDPPRN